MMIQRALLTILLCPVAGFSQSVQTTNFGGSGVEAATSLTVDAQGSVYIAGTTTSFDLPVLNAYQPANRGTELLVSRDSGRTWKPLPKLSPPDADVENLIPTPVIAVSPFDPNTIYAGNGDTIYKSTDGGQTFTTYTLPLPVYDGIYGIDSGFYSAPNGFVIASTAVYVSALGGIFRSYDAGLTWSEADSGISMLIDSIALDPFHANTLWAWAGRGGYISTDGATTWNPVAPSLSTFSSAPSPYQFIFDPVTPGVIYGPGMVPKPVSPNPDGLEKSTDGGQTWTPFTTPFPGTQLTVDPVRAGHLYAVYAPASAYYSTFYRSTDGGAHWESFPMPGLLTGSPAVDPANPDHIVCGTYRSLDGGRTWSVLPISRAATAVFGPAGSSTVYASASLSQDIFVVKYAADGATPLFATYFGGMGYETASSIRADGAGNAWVLGTTSSTDLPVTPDAALKTLTGSNSLFLAKFASDGGLVYCTYLGITGVGTLTISPDGSIWIIGREESPSPVPYQYGQSFQTTGFLMRLDPTGSQLGFFTDSGSAAGYAAIAVDASGNAIVVSTSSNEYGQTFTTSWFVTKYQPAGDIAFSRSFVGTTPNGTLEVTGVATDAAGNIYLAGTTSMTDFPVTANAYQGALQTGCTYPSYTSEGIGGLFYEYIDSNAFLTKLSPDGSTILYSTYLGGSCYDRTTSLAVTPDGIAVLAGETNSQDFPQADSSGTPPAVGQYESFVSVIDTNLSTLDFSSYLFAGSSPAVALSPDGTLHVAGDQGYLAQSQNAENPYAGLPATHAALFTVGTPVP